MSTFTFLPDESMENVYVLYRAISERGKAILPYQEFRRQICEILVAPFLAYQQRHIAL